MYTLYFNKERIEMKVSKASKGMLKPDINYTDEVTQYNHNYYICINRKPLIEKAKLIKQEWINEAEELLQKYKDIKM